MAPSFRDGQVPKRIRMRRTVTMVSSPQPTGEVLSTGLPSVAIIGMDLKAWTHVDGTVYAILSDGRKLALSAGDFDVLDWHAIISDSDDTG